MVKSRDKKAIALLSSIPKFKSYSKYSEILKKKFSNNSLKSFLISLKEPKYFIKPKFLEEFIKKHPYESDQLGELNPMGIKKICPTLLLEELQSEEEKKTTKVDYWHLKSMLSGGKNFNPEPDPFQYNPNYQSIYKNIPSYKFREPSKETIDAIERKKRLLTENDLDMFVTDINIKRNKGNNKKFIDKRNNNQKSGTNTYSSYKSLENIKNKNINKNDNYFTRTINNPKTSYSHLTLPAHKHFKTQDNFNNINKNPNLKIHSNNTFYYRTIKGKTVCFARKLNLDKSWEKRNHALKFKNYSPRKEKDIEVNDKITYLEPYDYKKQKNKALDFGKMEKRKEKYLINIESLNVPSALSYNPNYSSIESYQGEIYFRPKDIMNKKKERRELKIRKLWTSYKVSDFYQLVDNKKIGELTEKQKEIYGK